MNLPTKLTVLRLFLTVLVIVLLSFPFYSIGIVFPKYIVNGIIIELNYIVAGVIFIIASITDFLDGYLARKYDMVTNTGKMLDAIADKVLVDSILIILAAHGFINEIIPVIIVLRDVIVNAIKMEAANKGRVVAAIKSGKSKTATLMVGVVLSLFYDLPFSLFNLYVSDFMLYVACVLSIISLVQYYKANKEIIFKNIEIIN